MALIRLGRGPKRKWKSKAYAWIDVDGMIHIVVTPDRQRCGNGVRLSHREMWVIAWAYIEEMAKRLLKRDKVRNG